MNSFQRQDLAVVLHRLMTWRRSWPAADWEEACDRVRLELLDRQQASVTRDAHPFWKQGPGQRPAPQVCTPLSPNGCDRTVYVNMPQGAPCVMGEHIMNELGHCARCGARPNDSGVVK